MSRQDKDIHGTPVKSGADEAPSVVSLMDEATCVQQLMTCLEIGKALTSTFYMDRILEMLLGLVSDLIRAKNWTLFLLDPATQELTFELVVGLDKGMLGDVRIKLGEGVAGTVALTGEPILVPDVSGDPRFSQKVDELTGFVTRSIICLPLKIQDSVIGVVEIVNPENPVLFDRRSMMVLSIVSDYLAIALGNARNYKEIEALSVTDDVTGFYNARFLHQHLDGLLQPEDGEPREVSLVFLDLDDFKRIVDAVGHPLGSKVLKEVAQVIAARLAVEERLVRYGGDEFIVILPGVGKAQALEKVESIRAALDNARFLQHEGLLVKVTASFGIAHYPQDAADKNELLHIADNSMYHSKIVGKDAITLA
jgi:diguanylate cyclase (GGDEF)-like protein